MSNKGESLCLVCDDVSIGINFGVPTCMPCKAFFRRNALKLGVQEFACQNDGHCLITYGNRRLCNCCRLAKCFRVGMKKSLILSDEERQARNKLVEINRLKRGKIPKQQVGGTQSSTIVRMTQSSARCLSSSDQVVLANIFHAYENTCIAAKKTQFPCFPLVPHTSIPGFLAEVSSLLPIILEYFKQIPQFASINMDDKLRLVKNHFGIMLNINEPVMHPLTSTNLITTWTAVFGVNITARLLKRNEIIQEYTIDSIILKLMLIILVLCTGNARNTDNIDLDQICDDSLYIFSAQCIYVELLWKYILSRSSTEANAVKYLNKLIMFIFHVQKLHLDVDGYVSGLKDEIQQMPPLMQNMWIKPSDEEATSDINIT